MTGITLGIVLVAAFIHAGWNFLAKKSHRKIVFIWWTLLITLIFYFPMFIFVASRTAVSGTGWICIIATIILHAFYFWFLGGAYERGDLSLVYPLSRGFGPFLVPFLAVFFIREQLALSGIFGIAFVICGIYCIHLRSFSFRSFLEPLLTMGGKASLWSFYTGVSIAAYSIVDKIGVSLVFPPFYIYLMFLGTFLCLSPYIWLKKRTFLKEEWQMNKVNILVVGVLDLLGYMMILFAMQMTKVSYVVAAREVSIVFSALLGIIWLQENYGPQKSVGSFLIAVGVVLIGISH